MKFGVLLALPCALGRRTFEKRRTSLLALGASEEAFESESHAELDELRPIGVDGGRLLKSGFSRSCSCRESLDGAPKGEKRVSGGGAA